MKKGDFGLLRLVKSPATFLLLLGFFFSSSSLLAQKTIEGIVYDDAKLPLPGAAIEVKGTSGGTITNIDGEFSIEASPTDVLIISFVGYADQEITVGDQTKIVVYMESSMIGLNEVVAIGYGTQRKGDVSSAVTSVKADEFLVGRISDAAELVKGKVAGLSITNTSGDPNATSSIMLRGITTILGSVEPLVLVDGIQGSLTTVAPENIESIDVLKDASAAAIYGTRGANGVILITTKSGKRESKATATYSGYGSISEWYKTADFMDMTDVIYGRTNFEFEGYDTDWLQAVTRKGGYRQNHNLSLTGGSEKSTYSANIWYVDEEGIMRKSDRNDLKTQLDFSQYALNDVIKFNVNLLYSTHKNTNNNNTYVYRQALIRNPTSAVYDEDGVYEEDFSKLQYYNPLSMQNEQIGDTRSQYARLVGNVTVEPIKNWKTNLMVSRTESEATSQNYYTSLYYGNRTTQVKGSAGKSSARTYSDNLEFTSKYNFNINKSSFSAMAGYSYLYNMYDGFNAGNSEFASESYLYNDLNQGAFLRDEDNTASLGSYKNDNTLIGFFGRATFGYDNRYNGVISIRREGSSKFGVNHQWGTFPSASAAWTISNESFMQSVNWLNNLKLRAGFGITGVIPTDSYMSQVLYDYDTYGYHLSKGGDWESSLAVSQNPNPNLKWEVTREFNIGLDWSVLNNRLSGAIDVYDKKTSDLLYEYAVPVPPNLYNYTTANVGEMQNRGIELMVTAKPVATKDFTWNTTLTLAHNSNKLLSLSNDLYETDNVLYVGGVSDPISVTTHIMEVGHRLGDFFGLRSVGVDADGMVLVEVKDDDGNWYVKPFSTDDYVDYDNRQRLGNGLPQIYAGWNNTFNYKNWDLNMQFTGQFGFQILNVQRSFYENNSIAYNRLKSAAKYYSAVDTDLNPVIDPNTGKQAQVQLSESLQQGVWSDHIEDGDFVKLANLTLGYTFPLKGSVNNYIQNLRLYVSGQNLFTITKYSGLDPEVSNYFLYPGIDDRDKYPTVSTYTMGLTVNF